jgi:four helix bundle protein
MIDEHDLCDRTFRFACNIITLCDNLQQRRAVVRRLSFQLLDAGTSIGANLEEGRAGQTKPDFIAKNFNSLKEARETRYWLRLMLFADPALKSDLQPLLAESNEFIAMLTTSLKNARLTTSRG